MNFHTSENNLQVCSICKERIPKCIKRLSFPYRDKFGIKYVRICSLCIRKCNKKIKRKEIQEWERIILEKQI